MSILFSYYSLGYISNFYSTYFEITLLTLLVHSGMSIFFYYVSGRARRLLQNSPVDFGIITTLFIICSIFALTLYKMAGQFTSLFDASYFLLEKPQLIYFILAVIPALPISTWLLSPARHNKLKQTLVFEFIKNNLPGLLISVSFSFQHTCSSHPFSTGPPLTWMIFSSTPTACFGGHASQHPHLRIITGVQFIPSSC
ncbi:MAG: hypothetical protein IPL17_03040 [Anaerolineales bacterium]|nr:hypothetical protein [Anaerolineales bacterium]